MGNEVVWKSVAWSLSHCNDALTTRQKSYASMKILKAIRTISKVLIHQSILKSSFGSVRVVSSYSKMPHKVLWVDSDCGFDDLSAVCMLHDYMGSSLNCPKIKYVSTVNGMTSASDGSAIFATLFQFCDVVIARGMESQSLESRSILDTDWGAGYRRSFTSFISEYLPSDSLLTGSNPASNANVVRCTNLDEIVNDMAGLESTSRVVLLCLGPLTNIAYILQKYPNLFRDRVEKLVMMGGAVRVGGNAPFGAEYNCYLDAEAASYVFKHCPAPIELLGLEVANDKVLTEEQYQELMSISAETDGEVENAPQCNIPVNSTAPYSSRSYQLPNIRNFMRNLAKHSKDALSYDAVVSFYLIHPDAFTLETMDIKIDSMSGRTSEISNGETAHPSPDCTSVKVATSVCKLSYLNFLRSLFRSENDD